MRLIVRAAGAADFLIGDAVQLNTGGPVMTVFDLMPGWVLCNFVVGTDMRILGVPAWTIRHVERRLKKAA